MIKFVSNRSFSTSIANALEQWKTLLNHSDRSFATSYKFVTNCTQPNICWNFFMGRDSREFYCLFYVEEVRVQIPSLVKLLWVSHLVLSQKWRGVHGWEKRWEENQEDVIWDDFKWCHPLYSRRGVNLHTHSSPLSWPGFLWHLDQHQHWPCLKVFGEYYYQCCQSSSPFSVMGLRLSSYLDLSSLWPQS